MIKIGKYFREVSVVVIGVAITVSIGLWVTNNDVKKNQKLYFNAIILELEENAENFDSYAKMLQKSVKYSNYLNSHEKNSLNRDSIEFYAWSDLDGIGWGNSDPVILYHEDAFEMFKSSGDMRQVNDKELLLTIWKVYHLMKNTQSGIDDGLRYKRELGMNYIQRIEDGEKDIVPIKYFYINDVPSRMANQCEYAAKFIKATLSKLEKSKIVAR